MEVKVKDCLEKFDELQQVCHVHFPYVSQYFITTESWKSARRFDWKLFSLPQARPGVPTLAGKSNCGWRRQAARTCGKKKVHILCLFKSVNNRVENKGVSPMIFTRKKNRVLSWECLNFGQIKCPRFRCISWQLFSKNHRQRGEYTQRNPYSGGYHPPPP